MKKEIKKLDYSVLDWIAGVPLCNINDFEFVCDTFKLKYRKSKIFNHKVVTFELKEMSVDKIPVIFELVKNNLLRITRIDIKFDYEIDINKAIESDLYTQYSNIIIGLEGIETIYYGNRGSNLFCRIYNKAKELKLDEKLTRVEYEIKGDLAEEFNEQIRFFDFDNAISLMYKYILEFNQQKGINMLDNYETIETLKINILNEKSEREKFKNFCIHNGRSINKYISKYDLSWNMFFNLINDIPNFDKNLDIYINR